MPVKHQLVVLSSLFAWQLDFWSKTAHYTPVHHRHQTQWRTPMPDGEIEPDH